MSERIAEKTHEQVKASFGPNAQHYTQSRGHADADSLGGLVRKVQPTATDRLLDIGTGAGHTAIAFAPFVADVIAFDLTPQMLEETKRNAAAKGVTNLTVQQGAAEKLPFDDAAFDLVVCRLTTHHFADIIQAVKEMQRVLKNGGRLIIVDTTTPEDEELARQINQIELLRDPSHVCNYRPSQWRHMLEQEAGLKVTDVELSYYDEGSKMDFDKWTARIGTSPENITQLTHIFNHASSALMEALQIEIKDGKIGFALPIVVILAIK